MADRLTNLSEEQLGDLKAAIESLPALEREAFLLACRDRLPSDQVAKRLNVSPHRAERLIASALSKLDARLSN
jgi:RNA polymerase sigma factor (sigma-70 family)